MLRNLRMTLAKPVVVLALFIGGISAADAQTVVYYATPTVYYSSPVYYGSSVYYSNPVVYAPVAYPQACSCATPVAGWSAYGSYSYVTRYVPTYVYRPPVYVPTVSYYWPW